MLTIFSILFLSSNAYAGGEDQVCVTETREVEVCREVDALKPETSAEDAMAKAKKASEAVRALRARVDAIPDYGDRIEALEAAKRQQEETNAAVEEALAVLDARVAGTAEQLDSFILWVNEIDAERQEEIRELEERIRRIEERMDGFSGLMTVELGTGGTLGRSVSKVVDPFEGVASFRLGAGIENRRAGVQIMGGFVKLFDDSHRVDISLAPHLRLGERVILGGNIGAQFADYGMVYGRQLDPVNGGSTGFLRGLTTGGTIEGVLLENQKFRMTLGGRIDAYGLGSDWSVNGGKMGIRADGAAFIRFVPKVDL